MNRIFQRPVTIRCSARSQLRWEMDVYDQVCGNQGPKGRARCTIHNFTYTGHPVVLPFMMPFRPASRIRFKPQRRHRISAFAYTALAGAVRWSTCCQKSASQLVTVRNASALLTDNAPGVRRRRSSRRGDPGRSLAQSLLFNITPENALLASGFWLGSGWNESRKKGSAVPRPAFCQMDGPQVRFAITIAAVGLYGNFSWC
ncbi:hypothetical protein BJ166DRAFT_574655 [Pestalotiopsis sp. NC0098]|nr:hypothetical protein BJ166DRAFT_574655 [Pestalotiopsis sp. NC0098]